MPNFKKTQNTFSTGVVSPDFAGRGISDGMSKLENIFITPTGVLSRRPGTNRIDEIYDPDSLIIPFGKEYLLVMSAENIRVYKDGTLIQAFLLGWEIGDIRQVQWVQRFDTMIFVHPENPPKVLRKNGALFSFSAFQFVRDANNFPIMPFMRFPETENVGFTVTSYPSGGTNWARITATAPIWDQKCVGSQMLFIGRKWTVNSYISPTELIIATTASFTIPNAPITDWKESAFSEKRGWPSSITFFQDRLVFGGSRDWPCGLWLSKTGAHHNFDVGTGLDDEAIFITLLSETQQKICTCVASRDLQVLTDSGEWAISASPLTPSNINVRQHTSIGILTDRFVPPQKINGNTIFISKNNHEIRELALDELGENYNANDLSLFSKHLIDSPISMAYSAQSCQLFVVMGDGSMAVLTKQPAANISAWCQYKTAGLYKSVAVQNGNVYAIVDRVGGTYLEMFSDDAMNDSDEFDFSWRMDGVPLFVEKHNPKKIRIIHAAARIIDARHLQICGKDFYFGAPFSGDVETNILGTNNDALKPLWSISSGKQFPIKILSVTIDGSYEI